MDIHVLSQLGIRAAKKLLPARKVSGFDMLLDFPFPPPLAIDQKNVPLIVSLTLMAQSASVRLKMTSERDVPHVRPTRCADQPTMGILWVRATLTGAGRHLGDVGCSRRTTGHEIGRRTIDGRLAGERTGPHRVCFARSFSANLLRSLRRCTN